MHISGVFSSLWNRFSGGSATTGWDASPLSMVPSDLQKQIIRECGPEFRDLSGLFASCTYAHRVLRQEWVVAYRERVARRILKKSGWSFDVAALYLASSPALHAAFSELSKRAYVCRRWNSGCERGGTNLCYTVGRNGLSVIACFAPNLEELYLERALSDEDLKVIGTCGKNLQKLAVRCASDMTSRGMKGLVRQCTSILSLDLSDVNRLSDVAFKAIAKYARSLQDLRLAQHVCTDQCVPIECSECDWKPHRRCDLYVDEKIVPVKEKGRWLDLASGMRSVSDAVACRGGNRAAGAIQKLSDRMERLTLRSEMGMTDEGLAVFLRQSTHLLSLRLEGCDWLTNDGLVAIATYGTQLTRLTLRECTRITEEGLRRVMRMCAGLRHLRLAGCSQLRDRTLRCIAHYGKELRKLDISGCTGMRGDALELLLSSCTKLSDLDLGWCPWVGDGALMDIATYGTQLKALSIAGPNRIYGGAFLPLTEYCMALESLNLELCWWYGLPNPSFFGRIPLPHKGLKKLNLKGCAQHSLRKHFCSLVEACQEIEELDLSDCSWVGSVHLMAIAHYEKNLKKLRLSGCELMVGFTTFIQECSLLEELHLDRCPWVGYPELVAIAKKGTRLKRLSVLGNNQVTKKGLEVILDHCPELREFQWDPGAESRLEEDDCRI